MDKELSKQGWEYIEKESNKFWDYADKVSKELWGN